MTIDKYDDIIDIRDVIARVEELEDELEGYENPEGDLELHDANIADAAELASLLALIEECKGKGGDKQWRGDWYPVTCIRDSYFKDYAQELADDIGAIPQDAGWPCTCIDWDKAARELRMDYTSVEFEDITYWVR